MWGLTIPRNVEPDSFLVKSIPVRVKALERVVVTRIVAIHRGIVLMAEDDARAGHTFTRSFAALATSGLLFVAFELTLATCQASESNVSIAIRL
jgi:hypothetical protein